ncbi:PP0621 family protein [Bordetella petrii]|uniref:Membrane protein n=1 Tax=Bordetella petrii (strain ATCC BAA-461 / DSM 12804 / CCUG 43448 / CIP 107267 / Se-1111R) TaxID=340100 RepID=A9ICL2_BORPD|nr:PP0621 family protein [Bordetella petrii]CAP44677.1 putative membrane protein [Bordetella petrii]
MGKLLIWVIIILAVMMIARVASARAAHKRHSASQPPRAPARRPGGQPVESMVRCAHCGIHLPRSEAVLLDGKVWCSRDHARLGDRPE